MSEEHRPNDQDTRERPPARNPFDESQHHEPAEKPALIKSRRTAAVAGMITGIIVLLLFVGICVLGSIAFGS